MKAPTRRQFLRVSLAATLATAMKPTFATAASSVSPDGADADITIPGENDEALRAKCREHRAEDPRPNILLIFTDQQTANAMSCAGNRWVNTPHMDALAARGVRFVDSYCASPICGPSRASMVTGLAPHQTGVAYNGDALPANLPTIGSLLREAGYYTAWTGKWHLPESFLREKTDSHGFHHRPVTPDLPWVALGDQTDFLTAMDAEFFLRWQVGKQPEPWFLGVSLHNPHDICYHILENGVEYANSDTFPPLPENFATDPDEPAALKMRRQNESYGSEIARTTNWTEERWRAYLHTYAHLTTQVDRAVGQVLRALEQGGWKENTLVIFTSDHGEGVAAHQWASKLSLYEESAKVPLIVSLPGQLKPSVRHEPVSALDLLPTLCDYAKAPVPENLPGRSLRANLKGATHPLGRPVVCELQADSKRAEIQGRMVRQGRYKYCVFTPGSPSEQLFDIQTDPGETKNLAGDPTFARVLNEYRTLLEDWKKTTGDPFPEIKAL